MPASERIATLSYGEYLKLEASAAVRHEYLRGEVFAMAGGTPEHGALAAAVMGELREGLRGRPCRVFTSDVRVRIRSTGLTTYPDATVVCGELRTDDEDGDAFVNPLLLVEVLSPSTEAWDRGGKAAHYRQIESLREIVLVSPADRRIEVQRRTDRGVWELHEATAGQHVDLVSVDVALDIDAVFHDPLS